METFTRPFDMVVTAIGFSSEPVNGLPFDPSKAIISNESGRVCDRVFVVGWVGSGPVGVIGTSKPRAFQVAEMIEALPSNAAADCPIMRLRCVLSSSGCRIVDTDAWSRIDQWERRNARAPAPREKQTTIAGLLAAFRRDN